MHSWQSCIMCGFNCWIISQTSHSPLCAESCKGYKVGAFSCVLELGEASGLQNDPKGREKSVKNNNSKVITRSLWVREQARSACAMAAHQGTRDTSAQALSLLVCHL